MVKYRLGDICEIVSGSTPKSNISEYWNGDVKWITPAELQEDSYIITDSVRKITKLGVEKTGLPLLPKGTVILSSRAPIGKVAIAGCDMYCNQGFKNLICSQKINNRYLYWFLKGNTAYLNSLGRGATFKEISKQIVANIAIPVPTMEEQLNIVKQLEKISIVIQLQKKELKVYDELIKSRFIELFENVENKIPLNSLCDVSGGYSFKSSDITSDGVVKILQIGNVYLDDVNWETTNYLPEGYVDRYSRFLLNEGDIVVALTRPIIQSLGNVKACIVKDSDMPCLLNQRVGRIVPKKNIEVNLKFIYGCLMTDSFTRYVESCCIGCSQPNISTKDIENYMVPDVSFKEQMEFVNFKEQADKSKLIIQKSLDELETLNKALMQKYFGGNGV